VLDRYLKEQQQKKIAVRETRTLMADSVRETRSEAAQTVRESRTPEDENGGNQPTHSVRETPTHILHHIPSGDANGIKPLNPAPEIAVGRFAAGRAA
jgi:hypothetical protein